MTMTEQDRIAYAERILASANEDGTINNEMLQALIDEGKPSDEDQAAILNIVADLYHARSAETQQEEVVAGDAAEKAVEVEEIGSAE